MLKSKFHKGDIVAWSGGETGTVHRVDVATDDRGEMYWRLTINNDNGNNCRVPENMCKLAGDA